MPPTQPSTRMRAIAARRRIDHVEVRSVTRSDDVDRTTLQPVSEITEVLYRGAARVVQSANEFVPTTGRTFGERELGVILPLGATVEVGHEIELLDVKGDATLNGEIVHPIEITRDTARAVRYVTCRMRSTT